MQSRIEIFRQMLEAEPDNTMVMFGLAKEYEKLGEYKQVIDTLEQYLAKADDEGNAYGTLATAYMNTGDREKAIDTLKKGIDVSLAHGHPSMANEYKMTLDLDYGE
jgi:tetratricopeptide (TPR) repeat protein